MNNLKRINLETEQDVKNGEYVNCFKVELTKDKALISYYLRSNGVDKQVVLASVDIESFNMFKEKLEERINLDYCNLRDEETQELLFEKMKIEEVMYLPFHIGKYVLTYITILSNPSSIKYDNEDYIRIVKLEQTYRNFKKWYLLSLSELSQMTSNYLHQFDLDYSKNTKYVIKKN